MRIGIVGATGLVGSEIVKVLVERQFPVTQLKLWASQKSAGEKIEAFDESWLVEGLKPGCFDSLALDFVFFAGGGDISAEYAKAAQLTGAVVIDNSSHYRLHQDVPLVVPEVNPEDVPSAKSCLIANPNCSTIQMLVALKPLHDQYSLKRVIASTYQSVSGAGAQAIDELEKQVGDLYSGKAISKEAFPHQIAFNCLPHIDVFQENGMTKEEMKMILESRKILKLPELKITATCVRVPVFISHAESLNLEFEKPFEVEAAKEVLSRAKGIEVIDRVDELEYPLQAAAAGIDHVQVGRIRRDESVENGLHLWVVADNLRKGAATNAVQIAETWLQQST